MEIKRQIIAIGGGGFTAEPQNLALDAYILAQSRAQSRAQSMAQSRRQHPAVCFVGTASGDAVTYISKFYGAYSQLDCEPTHLPFFGRTPDLRSLLLRQDLIYVGGGNTKSMLAVWHDWKMPEVLHEAWEAGIVLCGISAGAICWFEAGLTDSWDDALHPLSCLGFLAGACCPHYDGEPERRPALHDLVAKNSLPATLALEDHVAAHFIGNDLRRIVTSRPGAGAFRVSLQDTKATETPLPAELLQADCQS